MSPRAALHGVYKRRCASCHNKRPRRDAASHLNASHIGVHVRPSPGQWNVADSGMRVRHLNLTSPEHSAALLAPLAKGAGGWGACGNSVFANAKDPDYRKILQALTSGVVTREQPGVRELLLRRGSAKTAKRK